MQATPDDPIVLIMFNPNATPEVATEKLSTQSSIGSLRHPFFLIAAATKLVPVPESAKKKTTQ